MDKKKKSTYIGDRVIIHSVNEEIDGLHGTISFLGYAAHDIVCVVKIREGFKLAFSTSDLVMYTRIESITEDEP